MKKLLLLLLMCCLAFTLVACNSGDEKNTTEDVETLDQQDQVSEIDVSKVQEVNVGEAEDAVTMRLPEQATEADTSILDSGVAQTSFMLNSGSQVVVLQSAGNVTLSEIDDKFENEVKVDINGMVCNLRYFNNDEASKATYGVAEAYDEDSDTSYFVMIVTNATKADLIVLMQIVSGK